MHIPAQALNGLSRNPHIEYIEKTSSASRTPHRMSRRAGPKYCRMASRWFRQTW